MKKPLPLSERDIPQDSWSEAKCKDYCRTRSAHWALDIWCMGRACNIGIAHIPKGEIMDWIAEAFPTLSYKTVKRMQLVAKKVKSPKLLDGKSISFAYALATGKKKGGKKDTSQKDNVSKTDVVLQVETLITHFQVLRKKKGRWKGIDAESMRKALVELNELVEWALKDLPQKIIRVSEEHIPKRKRKDEAA